MAYSSVGNPRFYVNVLEWLNSSGHSSWGTLNHTLPVTPNILNSGTSPDYTASKIALTDKNFIAHLGHTMASSGVNGFLKGENGADITMKNIVNQYPNDGYDGFSISTFIPWLKNVAYVYNDDENWVHIDEVNAGTVVVGTYYDMPHSPDLKLTMTREYGGIKTIETKGGASLSNAFYTKPPMWGNLGAWELNSEDTGYPNFNPIPLTNQKLSRSGRRIWDLNFSYLDDGDVFGSNQSVYPIYDGDELLTYSPWGTFPISPDTDDDLSSYDTFTYNLLTDYNFYSQIHKTNGGQLPFIFQPDVNDNTQFAICKFDMKSFSFQQTAPGLYSVKMKIREVW